MCLVLKVLKKHYQTLWRCFPDDYMTTITTMCQNCNVNEGILELIIGLQSPEECNRTILDYIIHMIKGDGDIMGLCGLMEKFIINTRFSKIVSEFKKGTHMHRLTQIPMCLHGCIDMYTHTYTHTNTHTHTYTHTHTLTHACTHTHAHIHIHTHIHVHTCACAHTYT